MDAFDLLGQDLPALAWTAGVTPFQWTVYDRQENKTFQRRYLYAPPNQNNRQPQAERQGGVIAASGPLSETGNTHMQ
jgi:hypothetical protein